MVVTKSDESPSICPKFEYTFSILGKKWNGLIIDALLESPLRFKEIAACISGISDRVLVDRLKGLEEEGIIERTKVGHCNGYSLTEKGYDLEPVMTQVQKWADKWVLDEDIEDLC